MRIGRRTVCIGLGLTIIAMSMGQGCPSPSPAPGTAPAPGTGGTLIYNPPTDVNYTPVYNNTTDKSNGGATYTGSEACQSCHPAIAEKQVVHGHTHKLNAVVDGAPTYPPEGRWSGVPNPPQGFAWSDISYVIGGYIRKGRFIDQQGYVLTTGYNNVNPQWNLTFGPNGTIPSFVAYKATPTTRLPYDYSCFVCHTTGPAPQDPGHPMFQENRPGMAGTWREAGVQCEACHGPGSNHVPDPHARALFVDSSARACGECHTRPHPSVGNADGQEIEAKPEGFIDHHEQWPELLASGGHSTFQCITCHDPHTSSNFDLGHALRKQCTDCHAGKTMGFHTGKVYSHGDYVENLTCVSCHMPYVSKSAASTLVGDMKGRVGDMKTHIFRISTDPVDYTAFFTADKTEVAKDSNGRAAVTVDFVCLRCHNTENGFPFKLTIKSASEIASGIHSFD